jgi:hypothetical protein
MEEASGARRPDLSEQLARRYGAGASTSVPAGDVGSACESVVALIISTQARRLIPSGPATSGASAGEAIRELRGAEIELIDRRNRERTQA